MLPQDESNETSAKVESAVRVALQEIQRGRNHENAALRPHRLTL